MNGTVKPWGLERLARLGFRTFVLPCLAAAALAHAQPGFLEPEQAFRLGVDDAGGGSVLLHWDIAPGYYLYRDRIAASGVAGAPPPVLEKPPGESKSDPNFGTVAVYHAAVDVPVHATSAGSLDVTWQGCAEQGICYPPQHRSISLQQASSLPLPSSPPATVAPAAAVPSDTGISALWSGHGLAWSLALALLLGVGLAFTPCVLPMLPIVSTLVVGQHASTRRAFALSLAFALPMALVYAGLGLLAAWAGAGLQGLLQARWMVLGLAATFVVLALSMFGWFELQLPAFVRDRLARVSPGAGSVAGAAALGVLSALLVGPCMTAPLAGTLLYIAQTGNAVHGAALLFALGIGMGAPLVAVATLGARWLPRPGPWMDRVKGAFGFLMLASAAWMAQRVVSAPVTLLLWGALLATLAVTVWHAAAPRSNGGAGVLVLRSAAAFASLWAAAMVLGAAAGGTDPLRPLADLRSGHEEPARAQAQFAVVRDLAGLRAQLDAAKQRQEPALVDFSADWCTSCKTIDRQVFGDPQVNRALRGVTLLRADVTNDTAQQQDLMRRLGVVGPPTLMLFDARGNERRGERLVGEFPAADLLQRVAALKEAS
jgi:thioredoxin:protein disulfide reductase